MKKIIAFFAVFCCLCITPVDAKKTTLTLVFTDTWRFERNFNPYDPVVGSFHSQDFIYEPLYIFNSWHPGVEYPRLASSYEVASDLRSVVFNIRKGVKWSDGKPFTARDVAFTFNYARRHPELQLKAGWYDPATDGGIIRTVEVLDKYRIRFRYHKANSIAHTRIANVYTLPEHIFKNVDNPLEYKNADPVGTGPFTDVSVSVAQGFYFKVCRNPHYWDAASLAVDCLKIHATMDSEELWLRARMGNIDWMGQGQLNPEEKYARHNKHNRYWFAPAAAVNLTLNTTKAPFNDIQFRKAMSLAMDRPKMIEEATNGLATEIKYPIGIGETYNHWFNLIKLEPYRYLMQRNLRMANEVLDKAGYYDLDGDGYRENPDGSPLTFRMEAPNGWTDWVKVLFVIEKNLHDIGVKAVVEAPPVNSWFENISQGNFDAYLMWTIEALTPWDNYDRHFNPVYMQEGQIKDVAMHQFRSHEIMSYLDQFVATANPEEQKRAMTSVASEVANQLPFITLYTNAAWYEFNDSKVTGWVDEENPFVRPTIYRENPERLIHLLNLRPRS